jgi:hypothetical protein
MAWTTPASWSTSEVVTSAKLNAQVRDNLQYLKDVLDGAQTQELTLRRASTDNEGQALSLQKARGSLAAPASVADGDKLGIVFFHGHDGAGYKQGAFIIAQVSGTPGTNSMPTLLAFHTAPAGSVSPQRRLGIGASGETVVYGQLRLADGSAAAPAVAFDADTDTGWYRPASNQLALTLGGTAYARFVPSGESTIGSTSFANNTYRIYSQYTNEQLVLMLQTGITGNNSTRWGVTGSGIIWLNNVPAAPANPPGGSGYLFVENGALKYRSANGTVTTIAPL